MWRKPKVFMPNTSALSLCLAVLFLFPLLLHAESPPAENVLQSGEGYRPPIVHVTKTSRLAFHPTLGGTKVIALGARSNEVNDILIVSNDMVVFDQTVNVPKHGAKTISLFGGAVGRKTTSFEIVGRPSKGSLQALNTAGGLVTYVPDAGFVGEDSFTFRIRDGLKNSKTATVKMRVGIGASVNQPTVVLAGNRSLDAFTREIEAEGVVFALAQSERQRDFFEDLRAKNLDSAAEATQAREFQAAQAERQKDFSADRAEKIRDNEEEKAADEDRPAGFSNRDFGFVLKRSQFVLDQLAEKNAFLAKLNDKTLTSEERIAELNKFFAKQREEAVDFLKDFDDN